MNTGDRLRTVQYQGHLAIDAIYQPLAAGVHDLILRYAIPGLDGIARLAFGVIPFLRSSFNFMLTSIQPKLAATILNVARKADAAANPVGPVDEASVLLGAGAVASSLFRAQPMIVGQMTSLLVRGVSMQLPASEVARTVSQYVSPWFATRRNAAGTILRADRAGVIQSWPGRSGMASAHARMQMLYESTKAHVRATLRLAGRENKNVFYRVAAGHSKSDQCDGYAKGGPYAPGSAPQPPVHPRCRCWLETVEG